MCACVGGMQLMVLAHTLHAVTLRVQWYAGDNADLGKDYTLYSKIDGIVIYQKKQEKSKVRAARAGRLPHVA